MGGGGTSAVAIVEAAVVVGDVDVGATAARGALGWLKRQPKIARAARAQLTAVHVANTLIREEFFQNPRMLRGTSNS